MNNIISHEGVTWRWERLIPNNSTILLFDLSPIVIDTTVSGPIQYKFIPDIGDGKIVAFFKE